MFSGHRSSLALVCLMPALCLADDVPTIDPQSEALYQQALPYLQQASSKLESIPGNFPKLSPEEKAHFVDVSGEAGLAFRSAIPLLEQAAMLNHPVAQYRLAQVYGLVLPDDAISEKVCPLLEKSLAQGFAPPALDIVSWCIPYSDTADFQAGLHSVQANMPRYESYYPQPTVKLECWREEPVGYRMQWGSAQDYQAEIFRILGDSNRPQRNEYYQKALDINDCYKVKRRMSRT